MLAEHDIRGLNELPLEQLRVVLKGYRGDWRHDTDESRGVPPPPPHKDVPADAETIDLPSPTDNTLAQVPLARVIGQRRSRRTYLDAPLSRTELSFLLWAAQGVSGCATDLARDADVPLRTVPSAGGCNPFETYLLVRRIEGLAPGLYRYLPVGHKLLVLYQPRDFSEAARMICYGQDHVARAAALFVWTAIPYRMEWRYAYLAHRMIAIEAGHVCQNLHLAAEAIGAGICALSGYDQTMLDRLINVDSRDEFTIYLASAGKIE